MSGENDQTALLAMPGQVLFQLGDALFIEGGEGFVENPQRRAGQIQTRQGHAALLAGGQGVTGNVFETLEADSGQGLPDGIAGSGMMQGAEPTEVFLGGQYVLDAGGVADPHQVAGKFAALFVEGLAVESNLTGGRLHQPGQQAQQTGLAAAIGAADLHHVTARQTQFEVFEQQAQVAFTGKRYGFKKRAGQEIVGLYGSSRRCSGRDRKKHNNGFGDRF